MVKKVLICDDDSDIVEMLEVILEDKAYQLITETDSRKVVDLIRSENPNLLLMDLWMPVLSGDQVLRQIREIAELEKLPVIIMSASRDGQSVALEAGANAYIAKPFDINELIGKVQTFSSINN